MLRRVSQVAGSKMLVIAFLLGAIPVEAAAQNTKAQIVDAIAAADNAGHLDEVLRHCSDLLALDPGPEPAFCTCASAACLSGDGHLGRTFMRKMGKRCVSAGKGTCRFTYDPSTKDPSVSPWLLLMIGLLLAMGVVVVVGATRRSRRRRRATPVPTEENSAAAAPDLDYEKRLDDELNDS